MEILASTKRLMQDERKISLEDVAKEARISRATIYRYFSNIELLILEASLDIQHKSPDQLLEDVETMSLTERIFYIQKHYNKLARENEVGFRRYLSAVLSESITSKEKLRGARRIKSLNKALKPFKSKLNEPTYTRLINISSVLMGIDSLVVCKDVCNLSSKESETVLRWGLEMILKGIFCK